MSDADEPKDRLIQTRVPRSLESTLKQEARRQRTTVSSLIRNALEDAFTLVDDVVADVDQILSDGAELAQGVRRNAQRLAATVRGDEKREPEAAAPGDALAAVQAWHQVVLNRAAACGACGVRIARGEEAFSGLAAGARQPVAWMCPACIQDL